MPFDLSGFSWNLALTDTKSDKIIPLALKAKGDGALVLTGTSGPEGTFLWLPKHPQVGRKGNCHIDGSKENLLASPV